MKQWLKEPIVWMFVAIFMGYGGVPLSLAITDKAEKRSVELYGHNCDVYIEWNHARVRIPAGYTPSILSVEDGIVIKTTYPPPARTAPGSVRITRYATDDEIRLYWNIFKT